MPIAIRVHEHIGRVSATPVSKDESLTEKDALVATNMANFSNNNLVY
jgi:hypothetical protein